VRCDAVDGNTLCARNYNFFIATRHGSCSQSEVTRLKAKPVVSKFFIAWCARCTRALVGVASGFAFLLQASWAISTANLVVDPGFESTRVEVATPQPASVFWSFNAAAGIAKNGNLNDTTYNPVVEGAQCAYLSFGGVVSQAFSVVEAGQYSLTVGLARTALDAKHVQIYLDDVLIAKLNPNVGHNDWGKAFSDQTVVFNAASGAHALKFVNAETGIVLIDNVRIIPSAVKIAASVPTLGNYVTDFSFEATRVIGRGDRPAAAAWRINANAGITRDGDLNDATYDPILDGTQCAFLNNGGTVTQNFPALSSGQYLLSIGLAKTASPARAVRVYFDDALVAVWNPDVGSNDWGKAFIDHSVSIRVSAGDHSLKFVNADTGTILIDNIRLVKTSTASAETVLDVVQVVASSQQADYVGPQNLISSQGLAVDPLDPSALLMQANALNFNSSYGTPNDETPLVHFDFGTVQSINAFHVWNGNEPGYTWRGFRGVTVQYSNNGTLWTSVPKRFEFKRAPGLDGYAGQKIALPNTITARFVRLVCNSTWRNFGNADIASLGRVKFYAGTVALPTAEPATRWPSAAGVVNVKAYPYFALGDGESDDTSAIQQAILDHEARGRTIYLPEGTYLVSAPLRFSANTANNRNGYFGQNTLRGDDSGSTTIRLKDATLTNVNVPQAVLSTGYISFINSSGETTTADWFNNNVSGLTIDVGSGNPGAKGLEFYSNNTGSVRDVRIVSGDGQGTIGFDLGHLDKNGPLLVKDLTVNGFALGVRTALTVNSQTFENIRLLKQTQTAFDNNGQSVSIKGLSTQGSVTAFNNRFGAAVLVDATLVGTGAAATSSAVVNGEFLFARDVHSSGFARTIENNFGAGTNVVGALAGDYVSSGAVLQLFDGPINSLRLTPPATPTLEDAPASSWVNVRDFRLTSEDNDAPAFQRAIDSGARDVYLPTDARIVLKSDVLVRGNVAFVHGMQALVSANAGVTVRAVNELNAPVVVFDRFSVHGTTDSPALVNASARKMVVLDSVTGVRGTGTGALFLENVVGRFEFGKHNTWARQMNSEPNGVKITNEGGRLWILGLKTERAGTVIATTLGGSSEVLGGLVYTTTAGTDPMFTLADSRLSATIGEIAYGVQPYSVLVQETRQGITRSLLRGQAPLRFPFLGGSALPLFVGSP
jgi:Pectate lyase superfamily protein/F5/8 type C domain/Protein of unknown function (DUF642)